MDARVLFDQGRFADTTVLFNGNSMRAHRLVLAYHSEPLDRMIRATLSTNLSTLDLSSAFKAGSWPYLRDTVRHMYGYQLPLSRRNVGRFLALARRLRCRRLNRACQSYLKRKLTVANCLEVWWRLAAGHFAGADGRLLAAARDLALNRFGDTLRHLENIKRWPANRLRWCFGRGLCSLALPVDIRRFVSSLSHLSDEEKSSLLASRRPRGVRHPTSSGGADIAIVFPSNGLVYRAATGRWHKFPAGFTGVSITGAGSALSATSYSGYLVIRTKRGETRTTGSEGNRGKEKIRLTLVPTGRTGPRIQTQAPSDSHDCCLVSTVGGQGSPGRLWAVYSEYDNGDDDESDEETGNDEESNTREVTRCIWLQEFCMEQGVWLDRTLVHAVGNGGRSLSVSHIDSVGGRAIVYVTQRSAKRSGIWLLRTFTLHWTGAITEARTPLILCLSDSSQHKKECPDNISLATLATQINGEKATKRVMITVLHGGNLHIWNRAHGRGRWTSTRRHPCNHGEVCLDHFLLDGNPAGKALLYHMIEVPSFAALTQHGSFPKWPQNLPLVMRTGPCRESEYKEGRGTMSDSQLIPVPQWPGLGIGRTCSLPPSLYVAFPDEPGTPENKRNAPLLASQLPDEGKGVQGPRSSGWH